MSRYRQPGAVLADHTFSVPPRCCAPRRGPALAVS